MRSWYGWIFVIVENLSGKKVELGKGSMKEKGNKRDLRVIENSKVAGEKRDNRKEKELLGIDGTSNEQERMNKGSGGNPEELTVKDGERRSQKEQHDKKEEEWKPKNIGQLGYMKEVM